MMKKKKLPTSRKALRAGISKVKVPRYFGNLGPNVEEWFQKQPSLPEATPGIPPRRAFCGQSAGELSV
jgi:hypothetical protein